VACLCDMEQEEQQPQPQLQDCTAAKARWENVSQSDRDCQAIVSAKIAKCIKKGEECLLLSRFVLSAHMNAQKVLRAADALGYKTVQLHNNKYRRAIHGWATPQPALADHIEFVSDCVEKSIEEAQPECVIRKHQCTVRGLDLSTLAACAEKMGYRADCVRSSGVLNISGWAPVT